MIKSRCVALLAALVLGNLLGVQVNAQDASAGRRTTVFISDLHLGVGHLEQDSAGDFTKGGWHQFEDFRWADEFEQFLDSVRTAAKRDSSSVDLVILGDFLELWQSADPTTCPEQENLDLGCTAHGALARARRVLGAHRAELELFRKFASAEDNRLIIVPGNHDAALVFREVEDAVVSSIGAPAGRVTIARQGYWLSPDNLIFAEHGHQFEDDVNHFLTVPEQPCTSVPGVSDPCLPAVCRNRAGAFVPCSSEGAFLSRPWGEQFVQGYYNQYELQFPIIDNIQGESNSIRYAVSEAKLIDVADAVIKGFGFLLTDQSTDQFSSLLGEQNFLPEWNLAAVRARPDGDDFLINSFVIDDELVKQTRQLLKDKKLKLPLKLSELRDNEIQKLCEYRYLRWKTKRDDSILCELKNPEDAKRLGAIVSAVLNSKEELLRKHLDSRAQMIRKPGVREGFFPVYIFGHTHVAMAPHTVTFNGKEWRPVVMNTGAWQRVATEEWISRSPKVRAAEKDVRSAVLKLQPEDLPPCYTYIYVRPYGPKVPSPHLVYWVQDPKTKNWGPSPSCPY